jgi:hypothetical protein
VPAAHHGPVSLPKYPVSDPVPMPDESVRRQVAVALLATQGVVLGLSLPVQGLMFLSLGWEGGDEALKHRMLAAMPVLGLGVMAAVVLAFLAAPAVWQGSPDALWLTGATALLVLVLGGGWLATLRTSFADPVLGPIWAVMTAPAPLAGLLARRLRAGSMPVESGSPPR